MFTASLFKDKQEEDDRGDRYASFCPHAHNVLLIRLQAGDYHDQKRRLEQDQHQHQQQDRQRQQPAAAATTKTTAADRQKSPEADNKNGGEDKKIS